MTLQKAICAGSFDPPTFGHINIIERGLRMFDRIIVAVATNSAKKSLFTVEERLDIMRQIFKNEERITFDTFDGLLVDFAKKSGATALIRGIRTVSDYEYELQMSLANRTMQPDIDTLFLMPESRYSHISSSIIKEIIKLGGSCKGMIHPFVESRMKKKLLQENR